MLIGRTRADTSSVPLPRRVLAAALALASLSPVAPLALARPDGSAGDAAARAETAAERLERAQAELAAGRARLEEAELRHREARADLEARLVAAYTSPAPEGLASALLGGLSDLGTRLEVIDATSDADAAAVTEFRTSLEQRERAVAELAAEATRLQRVADAEAAQAPEEAADAERAAASASVSAATTTAPAAPAAADGSERTELERLVARRRLPGRAPEDAETGTRISVDPAPAAPAQTVAQPYLGAPAATARVSSPATLTVAWYGPGNDDLVTASGERYDPAALSAASRTLPFGTLVRLERGGRSVTVRVNDRGPFGDATDLLVSDEAARQLDLRGAQMVSARTIAG